MPDVTTDLSSRTDQGASSSKSGEDFAHYRSDFPILGRKIGGGVPLAFLDNAASTQRPRAVIDAISDCFERYYANVHRGIHTLSEETTAKYEEARQTIARFINAGCSQEVIFTAGTTASINTVARSWGDQQITANDVILVTIAEHHANIVPWHQLAQRTGCRVVFLPLQEDFTISDDVVREHLAKWQPKLFSFMAASNVLGTHFPVKRWVQMARSAGATTLVDAAQFAPHQCLDVQDWQADFVVFSGHKMCGPTGIGVLYGRQQLLESMPPFLGGGGMIQRVTTSGFEPAELPEKFEAGTPPIAEAIGLDAAAKYLEAIGLDRIEAHERKLCRIADAGLREIEGVQVVGPTSDEKGGIVSFHIQGVHAHDVSQQLDTRGIAVRAGHHCTMPLHHALGLTSTTRASFYLYNTEEEAERLIEAVKEVRVKFAPSGRRRRR